MCKQNGGFGYISERHLPSKVSSILKKQHIPVKKDEAPKSQIFYNKAQMNKISEIRLTHKSKNKD